MIHLHNIFQTYQGPSGPVEALRGIDLNVSRGEISGVIGRSGAGKSSLVRTINLLNRPVTGQVLADDRDLMALEPDALRAARSRVVAAAHALAIGVELRILHRMPLQFGLDRHPEQVGQEGIGAGIERARLLAHEAGLV